MNKMIKSIGGLAAVALLGSGCAATNITQLTKALANDPATVSVKVNTIYGTASLIRVGELKPNSIATVSPDGTVTIKTP